MGFSERLVRPHLTTLKRATVEDEMIVLIISTGKKESRPERNNNPMVSILSFADECNLGFADI